MEQKETFGKYILQKRKAAGLSQKTLADKLFVSESAVSKWERGLSYPDITLVTSLCDALGVSEHELLTASDDMHQREVEEQSRGYLRIIRTYSWITYLCYAAALIPTFIVGLATGSGLSVFFITLSALLIVFSLLNVPVLVKRKRLHWVFWCTYGSLLLLLTVCRLTHVEAEYEHWYLMAIFGVSLGLLGVFLPLLLQTSTLEHPVLHHKGLICMAVDTVLIYLLIIFGNLFAGNLNNENLRGCLLFALLCTAIAWGLFALFRYTKLSTLLCSFITAEVCGILTLSENSLADTLIYGGRFILPEINLTNWTNDYVNQNLGVAIMICAGVLIIFALVRDIRKAFRAKGHGR
ncbi:MAG: helix-turn-helix domain-containing protein [Clostridiales bacterium]|nr:helix-turn-helix domain-containing protein [Clostridiales bacterium]